MTITPEVFFRSIWLSLMEPVETGKKVLAYSVPGQAVWTALALAAILHVILSVLILQIVPQEDALMAQLSNRTPFEFLIITGGFIMAFGPALYFSGMTLDGEGSFDATIKVFAWFQVVSLTIKLIYVFILMMSTTVGAMFGLLTQIALVWCLVHMTYVAHGFSNRGAALVSVVMAAIGAAIVTGILAVLLGVDPRGQFG